MDDRLERYLRQQAELGGNEVYLSALKDSVAPGSRLRAPEGRSVAARRLGGSTRRLGGSAASDSVEGKGDVEGPASPTEPGIELPAVQPTSRPTAESPTAQPPKWRKDAPPIPGPGLVVAPPEVGLLGDEVSRLESLDLVAEMVRGCRKCRLCEGRTQAVPGEGSPTARLMCVGEGPGAKEDETGRPFVGAAGQLLDQILASIECPRETVFIANIVKCRPPQNRKPLPDEALACLPYLHRQIALVRPRVLIALGGTAAEWLLGVKKSLGELRGKVHRYGNTPLVVTYHPAALLRNPNWKKPTWDDVRIARQLLEQ